MERLTIPELLDRLRWADAGTSPFEAPAVFVDCSSTLPTDVDLAAIAAQISTVPTLLIAVDGAADHPLGALLDLDTDALADPGGVDRLIKAVEANPIASVSLVLLLRGGGARSIGEGLV